MWALLQWLHLLTVIVIIVGANILQLSLRTFYALFPFKSVLDAMWERSRGLKKVFAFRLGSPTPDGHPTVAHTFIMSSRELIMDAGFDCEEHAVTTGDGYVLGLQRIVTRGDDHRMMHSVSADDLLERLHTLGTDRADDNDKDREGRGNLYTATATTRGRRRSLSDPHLRRVLHEHDTISDFSSASVRSGYVLPVLSAATTQRKPPVLLMHGLMQCSEAWLVGGRQQSLACMLAEAGYDVWLGNNRGNKYSQKHLRLHSDSEQFWDFSIDEFARYDIPAMVDHILACTGAKTLSYVGFSQGTAQCFAALALDHSLNDKLNVFIAMSPALAVRGLARSPLTALVETDLSFIYLLFGRRRMLPSSLDVQRVLSGSAWSNFLDGCLMYLFGWRADQIDPLFKLQAFHHIYSYTSVKAVVHWFQIISSGRFAMFYDVPRPNLFSWLPFGAEVHPEHRISPLYDTSKITVPIALFAGEADTLINIPKLLGMLPKYSRPMQLKQPLAVIPPQTKKMRPSPKASRRRTSTSSSAIQMLATAVHDVLGGWDDEQQQSSNPTTAQAHTHKTTLHKLASMQAYVDAGTGAEAASQPGGMKRIPLYLHVEPEWEHLDSMWASSAQHRAFPIIMQLLGLYSGIYQGAAAPVDVQAELAGEPSADSWSRNLHENTMGSSSTRASTKSLRDRLLQGATIKQV